MHSYSSSGYLNFVTLTITNQQSIATASPFQDFFSFNPSLYTSYESSDLGNIRFYADHSGTTFSGELNAWLESYSGSSTPNLATSATVWLNMPNGIAGDSSESIFLVFEQASTEFDGLYWGESPSLSSVYGQFDNGASVFPVYNNGASLFSSSQTGTGGSGPAITTSAPAPFTHAITGSVSGGGAGAGAWTTNGETTNVLPASYIAQMNVYLSGTAPLADLLTNVQSISSGQFYSFRLDARTGSSDLIGNYPSGETSTSILSQGSAGSSVSVWYQLSAIDSADQLSLYKSTSFGLNNLGTLEAGPVSGTGYSGGGVAVTTDGASSSEYWTMIIVRAYPPNGIMPVATLGSVQTAQPPFSFQYSYASPIATIESAPIILQSTSSPPFIPITLNNAQGFATKSGLQVDLNVDFRAYESYLVSDAGNMRFFNSSSQSASSELPAWLEDYSGNSTSSAYTATSSSIWLDLKGTVIGASSSITVYMVFENGVDFDGAYFGEAPQMSPAFGEYDNGANVFAYYDVAPTGTSGWTLKGSSGQTSSGPTGSHFGSQDAFYAKSASGNYLYSAVPNLGTNEILSFWTYTTGLGNVFFLADSSGKGQMARLDSRGGGDWSGLASTASWSSWNAPTSGLDESKVTWYKFDVVINSTAAASYIGSAANNLTTLGTRANSISASNYGNYLGLVGDALGAGYVTYWNGFIVRYYPPNGVQPSVSFGSPVLSGVATTVSPDKDAASIGVTSGLTFYESASAATSCSTSSSDTSLASPQGSTLSNFTLLAGNSVCLWSPQYSSATTIFAGSWLLDLWSSSKSLSGTLSVSIYATNSAGSYSSTIASSVPTSTISTTVAEIRSLIAGSQASVPANGYIEIVLTAPTSGPPSCTLYWGSKSQPTNFESPTTFTNVLAINNTSSSPMQLSLSVASSSGTSRLENLTIWIGTLEVTQISLGSVITSPLTSGPVITIPSSPVAYISLYASASAFGESKITLTMQWQDNGASPYTDYTIILDAG